VGIFGNRGTRGNVPALTMFAGDSPRLPVVRASLARGDVAGAVGEIRNAPLAERFELVWASADDVPYEWLVAQHGALDDDALLATYAGAAAMRHGWRARTNADAERVDREQFKTFWAWLAEAEQHLVRATSLAPDDATPWVYLLVTGRGLQHERGELERVFRQAVARDPEHLEAYRQMMQFLCKKWFGTHEDMFAFARSVSAAAPTGSPLHELPIFAHVERWVEFSVKDPHELQQRAGYFRDPAVTAELSVARERLGPLLTGAPDGRSVTARNMLAFVAWRAGDKNAFADEIAAMHGVVSPMPWNYYPQYGLPVAVVTGAWQELHK